MKAAAAVLCATLALPATQASAQPPTELRSSSQLSEDAGARDSWTYRNPKADLTTYKRFLIEPTDVYSDPGASWGGTSPDQRRKYAAIFTEALREEISKSYPVVDRKGPDVAVMKLTLLGVQPTKSVAATATRVTPLGLAFNGVKSLTGKEGSFTGSAQVAFEMTDSRSGELLVAAVRRRSPNALNIGAALSTDNTVEAVAEDVAKAIRVAVDKIHAP